MFNNIDEHMDTNFYSKPNPGGFEIYLCPTQSKFKIKYKENFKNNKYFVRHRLLMHLHY